jgi:type 1 fimbria pilin
MGLPKTLCALLAIAIGAAPSHAQCRLCTQPTTADPSEAAGSDVQLQIETSLNFDRLILTGGGPASVTIRPDGSSSAAGAVTGVGPRAMVGTVLVHGEPNRGLRVDMPRRIELYGPTGTRIIFEDVSTDLPPVPRLDAVGNLSFRFGGRLTFTGDADGQYRGDLPITVEYQ